MDFAKPGSGLEERGRTAVPPGISPTRLFYQLLKPTTADLFPNDCFGHRAFPQRCRNTVGTPNLSQLICHFPFKVNLVLNGSNLRWGSKRLQTQQRGPLNRIRIRDKYLPEEASTRRTSPAVKG